MEALLILNTSRQCKQIGQCTEKQESTQTPFLYCPVLYIGVWWNEEAVKIDESDNVDKVGEFEKEV